MANDDFRLRRGVDQLISDLLRVLDAVIMVGTAYLAFAFRHPEAEISETYHIAIVLGLIVFAFSASRFHLYDFNSLRSVATQVRPLVLTLALTFFVLAGFGVLLKRAEEFSRLWMVIWLGMAFVSIFLARFFGGKALKHYGLRLGWGRNVVLIGNGERLQRIYDRLKANDGTWTRIAGLFVAPDSDAYSPAVDAPVLGTFSDIRSYKGFSDVDDIIIGVENESPDMLRSIIDALRASPCDVRYCPNSVLIDSPGTDAARGYAGLPLVTLFSKPMTGRQYLFKFFEDKILGSILLVLFSPLMLAVALAIRMESAGPVLFRQTRYGFGGNAFEVFKFRTMYHEPVPDPEVPQAVSGDARITRVGRILRRFSIDELPNLFNVLVGDMSLVGPRPHAIEHDQYYSELIDQYALRNRMKPGVTGWAQVNGLRGNTGKIERMVKRVEFDIYYIDNWSLSFDLWILLRSCFAVLFDRNAF